MDSARLTRRPLKTLGQLAETGEPAAQLDELSMAEPWKADRLTNRLRAVADKFSSRKREGKREYNRKERERYRKKMPQKGDHRHKYGKANGPKRLSPEKRFDVGRLRER